MELDHYRCHSNILLISFPFPQVTACLFSTYELRRCRPRLEKLKRLLEERPFRGEEYEREEEVEKEEEEEEEGEDVKARFTARKVCS